MSSAEYRALAAELLAKAMKAPGRPGSAQLDALARSYLRLAEQAERNDRADVWAEFGPKPAVRDEGR